MTEVSGEETKISNWPAATIAGEPVRKKGPSPLERIAARAGVTVLVWLGGRSNQLEGSFRGSLPKGREMELTCRWTRRR